MSFWRMEGDESRDLGLQREARQFIRRRKELMFSKQVFIGPS